MYNNQVANNYMNYPYSANPYVRQSDYGQPQMQSVMPQAGLKGRPVSSIEEVKAAQIDFDGSVFIFPDITNGCIYTKQATSTGIIFNKYVLEEQNAKSASSDYVTREELNNIISELKSAIKPNLNSQSPAPAAEFNFV